MTHGFRWLSLPPLAAAVLLCACGGGSGSNSASTDGENPPAPPTPPPDGDSLSGGYAATSDLYDREPVAIPSWQPDRPYLFGQQVRSNGHIYQMVSRDNPTGGKSAASGSGPAGSGSVKDGDLLWADTGMTAPGKVYYVCDCGSETGPDRSSPASGCVNGDDSRDEQTAQNPTTPWRTLAHALTKFRTMQAGDTIALARGGVFTVVLNDHKLYNGHATLTNNCTLRDYTPSWYKGTGAAPLPVLEPSERTWLDPTDGKYKTANSGLYVAQGTGIRLLNLHLRRPSNLEGMGMLGGVAMSDGTNVVSGTTLSHLTLEQFAIGVVDSCGNPQLGVYDRTTDTVVAGCHFFNNYGWGVMMGGTGTILDSNRFDGNGGHEASNGNGMYYHSIYLSGHSIHPAQIRAVRNEIYRNVVNSRTGKSEGSDITLHGRFDGVVIADNLIDNTGIAGGGCFGIELSPGGYTDLASEHMDNVRITGNRVYGVGSKGIMLDLCTNGLIENNLIWVDSPGSGGVYAIAAPSLHGGTDPDKDNVNPEHYPKSERFTIRHNSIYFTDGGGGASNNLGIQVINDQGGSGHVVANNAISWNGKIPFAGISIASGVATAAGNALQDRAVATQPDLGFKEPEAKDFTLKPTSPLIDAGSTGINHFSPKDIVGKTRDARPDVGAYEH